MSSFYLNLPCYNNNCWGDGIKKYFSYLPKEINLKGNWVAGISEITFTKSFYNIKKNEMISILYLEKLQNKFKISEQKDEFSFIPKGFYKLEKLIDVFNEQIKNNFIKKSNYVLKNCPDKQIVELPELKIIDKKVVLKSGICDNGELIFVWPSLYLCEMLGYDCDKLLKESTKKLESYIETYNKNEQLLPISNDVIQYNSHPYKIYENSKHFYICSDICEDQIFGDTYKPLLRIVDIPKDLISDEKITKIYKKPIYFPVRKNPFRLITVEILEDLDFNKDNEVFEDYFEFNRGKMIITLEFKKVNNKQTFEYEQEPLPTEQISVNTDQFKVDVFKPKTPPKPIIKP